MSITKEPITFNKLQRKYLQSAITNKFNDYFDENENFGFVERDEFLKGVLDIFEEDGLSLREIEIKLYDFMRGILVGIDYDIHVKGSKKELIKRINGFKSEIPKIVNKVLHRESNEPSTERELENNRGADVIDIFSGKKR